MAVVDAAGQAAGAATAAGTAILFGVLAGLAAGQATVEGDAHPQGAGTAAGQATVAGTAAVIRGAAGIAAGAATVVGAPGVLILVTGFVNGDGEAVFNPYTDGAGTAAGAATVTGDALRIISVRGRVAGTSSFKWVGAPLPIHGTSFLVGNPVVDRHLPAIRAIVSPSKSFRYLQGFRRGDLPVYICDRSGPVSPVWIRFTLYRVLVDGSRWRKGPAQRAPAQGQVGEYYATGRAGESGQPGDWVIVWEFRRNLQSATQSKEMEFQVLDAALAADPRDVTVRCRKYGWN